MYLAGLIDREERSLMLFKGDMIISYHSLTSQLLLRSVHFKDNVESLPVYSNKKYLKL